ncbi:hypothetical protein [Micromonospora chalcea]|uniref:hypothetical protein n=1 Tax=Micromonospora chalcea TaxID=1874 RepID=UPI003D711EAD
MAFFRNDTNESITTPGGLLGALYTRITGRPYITVGGHASRDFGPTPAAEVAAVFDTSAMPDGVLEANFPQLLAEARRVTAELNDLRKEVQR